MAENKTRSARGTCLTLALAAGLGACGGGSNHGFVLLPPVSAPAPAPAPAAPPAPPPAPLEITSRAGWRIHIEQGQVQIRPPAGAEPSELVYQSQAGEDWLGGQRVHRWALPTRSLLLPDGAKITLQTRDGALSQLSLYDGPDAKVVDVQAVQWLHQSTDDPIATRQRDEAQADGETAHFYHADNASVVAAAKVQQLYLANLYLEVEDEAAGLEQPRAFRKSLELRALGMQSGTELHTNRLAPPLPTGSDNQQCGSTATGGLSQDSEATPEAAAPLTYVSRDGGWTIKIDRSTVTVTGYDKFTWQVWGHPHENLNGKHIKDWLGTDRSLLLPDGTKISMQADGPHGVVQHTSIYDGPQSHVIDNTRNTVLHSCVNTAEALARDRAEVDGETAYLTILTGPPPAQGAMFVFNIYDRARPENDPAVALDIEVTPLGTTGDQHHNPNQVNDLYDDPRLPHT